MPRKAWSVGLLLCLLAALSAPVTEASAQDKGGERATLPLSTLLELVRPEDEPAAAEPEYLLSVRRHHVDVALDDGEVGVRVVVDVEVYRPWTPVPLLPRTAVIRSVTSQGQPVGLVTVDDAVCALAPVPGIYTYTIEVVPEVDSGRGRASVPLLARPITTASIQSSDPTNKPDLSPVFGDATAPLVSIPPTERLEVTWRPLPGAVSPGASVAGALEHRIQVGDDGVFAQTTLVGTVAGPALRGLTLRSSVPLHGVVATGAGVGDIVSVGAERGPFEYEIPFEAPKKGAVKVELGYKIAERSAKTFSVPSIRLVDGEVSGGVVRVFAGSGVAVEAEGDAQHRSRSSAAGAAPDEQRPVFDYDFVGDDPRSGFSVERRNPQPVLAASISRARFATVVTDDDKSVTSVSLTVVNHQRPFLRVVLPEGAELWTVSVDGAVVAPVMGEQPGVLVALPQPAGSSGDLRFVDVSLTYYRQVDSPANVYGGMGLSLPVLNMVVADLQWELYVPRRYSYFDFEGSFEDRQGGLDAVYGAVEEIDSDRIAQTVRAEVLQPAQGDTPPEGTPEQAQAQRFFERLRVPLNGRRLAFSKTLVQAEEPLVVRFSYFDRDYVRIAEVVGLASLFLAMLSVFAHLYFVLRKARLDRVPRWFALGSFGALIFVAVQVLLPISWPPAWLIVLMLFFAGMSYGTVVFWTAIIGLLYKAGRAAGRIAKERGIAQALRDAARDPGDASDGDGDEDEVEE